MLNSNQFSLRALMIATAVASVLCCTFFTLPDWVGGSFLQIVMLLVMPASLALLVYGRGMSRAFAVGTAPPLAILLLYFTGIGGRSYFALYDFDPDNSFETIVFFAIQLFVVVASGFIGQAVRWWCLKNVDATSGADDEPPRNKKGSL